MRNETSWVYLPQSEERIVSKQIKERSKLEGRVSETLICTYIDLMRQIGACAFSADQRQILNMLMEGWSLRDIAEERNVDICEVERSFRNAVYGIVRQNDLQWKKVYGKYREKSLPTGSNIQGEESK